MKKAYPKYRKINLPWQSSIPDGWDLKRAKFLFKTIDHRSKSGEETLLSVSEHHGVIPRSQANVTMFQAESYEGYKLCEKGDLVINSLWAWSRGLGFSEYHGIISTAYDVFRLKNSKEFFYPYFNYLLRTKFYVGEYLKRSKGIWISRLQLSAWSFLEIPIILPPLPEQRQIAAFLDHKCALIDTFIQKKTRLIELLKEQKQAIINKTVTKGIDPNVRLKPSGIDWLGDIPEHWEVKKLKYVTENLNSRRIPIETTKRGRMTERVYDYYGATGVIDKVEDYIFDETTILLAEDGANLWYRNIQLVYIATGKYWVNNHAHILKPKSGALLEFIAHSLECYDYRPLLTGAAQPKLTKEAIMNISLVIPPKTEQKEIISFIESESDVINKAIARIVREIELLQEYKTTLIAEAVTGKIDVRDWKPKERSLPIETSKGATP